MTALTITELSNTTAGVSTATRSQVLRLNNGVNRIWISSPSWDGSKTATVKYADVADTDRLGTVKIAGEAAAFIANDGLDIQGPGYICFDLTSPDASAVVMSVTQCAIM